MTLPALTGSPVTDLKTLALALAAASLLAAAVAVVHRRVQRRTGPDLSFSQSLLALGPIICLIMVFIGNNLALSLGMVGSLSLIRFRTAVKEMSDLIFLLWVMAIGIGCGTANWSATALGTLLIAVLVLVLSRLKAQAKSLAGTLLVQVSDEAALAPLSSARVQQLVYLPTGVEAVYKLTHEEFTAISARIKEIPGSWRYIASQE